jgi:hypothetical protein
MVETQFLLAAGMFCAAVLYSSVGHAGASAYLALMALFSLPPTVMRPTALFLNILVASLISHRYIRAGLFRWRKLWPFLIGSVPFAFIGGTIHLPGVYYRWIVGILLLIAGVRFLWPRLVNADHELRDPPIWAGALLGIGIGLLSGLTGTGGGTFLSPVILFLGWGDIRTTSGIAASFILCNSIAGLLGNVAVVGSLPSELPLYAAAVVLGAVLGSMIGTRIEAAWIQRALGLVLIIAGIKLIGVY